MSSGDVPVSLSSLCINMSETNTQQHAGPQSAHLKPLSKALPSQGHQMTRVVTVAWELRVINCLHVIRQCEHPTPPKASPASVWAGLLNELSSFLAPLAINSLPLKVTLWWALSFSPWLLSVLRWTELGLLFPFTPKMSTHGPWDTLDCYFTLFIYNNVFFERVCGHLIWDVESCSREASH